MFHLEQSFSPFFIKQAAKRSWKKKHYVVIIEGAKKTLSGSLAGVVIICTYSLGDFLGHVAFPSSIC
jgi:hypothetical protein